MANWQDNLEIIGAELFQRYRKRLMKNGIALEIWQDYPGLSLPDLWVRVHAGRQILLNGDDFIALQAIRDGSWDSYRRSVPIREKNAGLRQDRLSQVMVRVGATIFAAFCLLTIIGIAIRQPGLGAMIVLAAPLVSVVYLKRRSRRAHATSPAWQ
ncbi:hypothetical protein [Thiosocius teredinicola]|uniref:hypothetical protein n=1 Tax=Thiosocius teredinicola TaxID=1973002 RepID=UPI000990FE15